MAAAIVRNCALLFRSLCSRSMLSPLKAEQLPVAMQGRTIYDWRMQKDMKRRQLSKEYAPLRTRINSIRKNTILPRELQEVADQEIAALPRDSCHVRIRNRCVLTARPRGVLRRWRLSRIVWRDLADYNKLSGVTRSCW